MNLHDAICMLRNELIRLDALIAYLEQLQRDQNESSRHEDKLEPDPTTK